MMRRLMLIPLFGLFLFAGQESFLHSLAYAKHSPNHCCMCGTCRSTCWCPGAPGSNCPYCRADDGETFLSYVSTDTIKVDIRSAPQLLPLNVMSEDVAESVMTLVHGSRTQGNFTLKLLDNVEDHVKFRCSSLEF